MTSLWNVKKVELMETKLESRMVITRGLRVGAKGRCWSKGANIQLQDG